MSNPKVSVLMPVYRTKEEHLKAAIDSILGQTFEDFEFLILDDYPEAPVENIVKSYSDPRIKYFKNNENLGISQSRNKLIDLAKGEYLAVFDHDDISLPERLEKEVAYLDNHPEVGVVGCCYERFPKIKKKIRPASNRDIENYLMQGCGVLHPSAMIRKSVLVDNNIFYENKFSPAEDYALFCRLIGKTMFYNIQEVLYRYRDHETNTSKIRAGKMQQEGCLVQDWVREQQPEIYARAQKEMPFRIQIKLFNCLPVFQFRQKGAVLNNFLRRIPFLHIKAKMDVK